MLTHSMPSGQHPRKQLIVIGKKDSSYPQVCSRSREGNKGYEKETEVRLAGKCLRWRGWESGGGASHKI